jgi:hypothetical protein
MVIFALDFVGGHEWIPFSFPYLSSLGSFSIKTLGPPQKYFIRTGRDPSEDLPDQLHFLIFVARLRKAAHQILPGAKAMPLMAGPDRVLQGHDASQPPYRIGPILSGSVKEPLEISRV